MTEAPKTDDAGLTAFMEYFRKNYPGPETIIGRPDWHSPKIFRAARHALFTPEALAASPEVAKLIADAEARGMERAAGIARRFYGYRRYQVSQTDSGGRRCEQK